MENKMKRQHILNYSFKGENNVKNFPVLMKETNPRIQKYALQSVNLQRKSERKDKVLQKNDNLTNTSNNTHWKTVW